MKQTKFVWHYVIALGLLLLSGCHKESMSQKSPAPFFSERSGEDMPLSGTNTEAKALCFDFVTKKLLENGGIKTNYFIGDFTPDYATGEEILSESQGLLMEYAALNHKASLFATLYDFTFETLDNGQLISYRYTPSTATVHSVNAAVDDLRIIKSLLLGAKYFQEPSYKEKALELAARFYTTNIFNHQLYDFYDSSLGLRNGSITLCYNDFFTLQLLSEESNKPKDWKTVYSDMLALTKAGYISDTFPLYYPRYHYKTESYEAPHELNMIEALLTVYHLAQVNECPSQTLDYIKELLEAGPVYGSYFLDGSPANTLESTAVYALCALIGKTVSDEALYNLSLNRMLTLQVKDQASPIYGSFGNPLTHEAFSFDNLMALLAYGWEP